MANYINISNTVPLKFYKQSDIFGPITPAVTNLNTFNPNVNNRHIDEDFYLRNVSEYMEKTPYFQPWQITEDIILQFEGIKETFSPSINPFTINLLDTNGKVVKSLKPTNGASLSATERLYSATMQMYDVPEGVYMVQIYMQGYFAILDTALISEPIEIKVKFKDTLRVNYYHTSNDYGIYYETGLIFSRRIFGQIKEMMPISTFKVYENDPMNLTLLNGVRSREWTLQIGTNKHGLTNAELDKLEVVFLHDKLFIDGIAYTRTEGSKLEKEPIKGTELSIAKITLREANNDTNVTVTDLQQIVLGNAPTSRMFYLDAILLPAASDITVRLYFDGMDRFLAYLNSLYAQIVSVDNEEKTFFSVNTSNKIVLNTNNASIAAVWDGASFNKFFQGWFKFDIEIDAYHQIQIDVFDSGVTVYDYAFFPNDGGANIIGGYATSDTIVYYYPTDGNYTSYFFIEHAEDLDLGSSEPVIKKIDCQITPNALTFSAYGSAMKEINADICANCNGLVNSVYIGLSKLTTPNIDELVIRNYEYIQQGKVGALTLNVAGQVPTAKPTGSGAFSLFKQLYIDNGGDLIHD